MKKTLLIVCEGTATEPYYFNHLRDRLIEEDVPITITISPRPPEEDKGNDYEQRPGSKRRTLKLNQEEAKEISFVEDAFKAQPLAYVREAQKGLEDGTYDEVWAVYDKDGHPKHKEAYDLALLKIGDKIVNIAFSSISFEYWILLHFEENATAFERSMCRTINPKKYFYCGSREHEEDCEGEICVCGRLVTEGFLSYQGKKKNFPLIEYHHLVYEAINRAVALERSYGNNIGPLFELNPITTVYKLVYTLLHLPNTEFDWFSFNQTTCLENKEISFSKHESEIRIVVRLTQLITTIIHNDFICLFDSHGQKLLIHQKEILGRNEQNIKMEIVIKIDAIEGFDPLFIGYKLSENKYRISSF